MKPIFFAAQKHNNHLVNQVVVVLPSLADWDLRSSRNKNANFVLDWFLVEDEVGIGQA